MVASNMGYPDPEHPSDDLTPTNEIIMVHDTDTDEEENQYNDYQPLPMNELADEESEDDDDSQTQEQSATGDAASSPLSAEDCIVKELWSSPLVEPVDIIMDNQKVDEVKQAMMGITLPASSIPEWAHNIPEEQWKQQLISKLQTMQNK